MDKIRTVVSVYQIDVNWDLIRAAGHFPTGGMCPGCAVPLNNIVGAFAQDSFAAAAFALHLLTFLAGAALLAYSYISTHRLQLAEHHTFFGLRYALLLFVLAHFFDWLYAAIPNATALSRGYISFILVPDFFQTASDILLFWTLTRTALQPLVVSARYSRAKSVGLGLTLSWAVLAAANWALYAWGTSRQINTQWSEVVWTDSGDFSSGSGLLDFIYPPIGGIWGVTVLALSVKALFSTRRNLDQAYQVVPKLTIAASALWIVRIALTAVVQSELVDRATGTGHQYSSTPLLLAVSVDILGLGLFVVLGACYRPHLMPLFAKDAGYVKSGMGRSGNAEEFEEGRASSVRAYELQGMNI